jgi:hypothetical protein
MNIGNVQIAVMAPSMGLIATRHLFLVLNVQQRIMGGYIIRNGKIKELPSPLFHISAIK